MILIGLHEQHNRLYFFRSVSMAAMVNGCTNQLSRDVQNSRLSCSSSKVVESLHISGFSSTSVLTIRHGYIRARQTRYSFPTSWNKTTSPFELINYDLWGQCHTLSLFGANYVLKIMDGYIRNL